MVHVGGTTFAAARFLRYLRHNLTKNQIPSTITINQGMIAAIAVISIARLSARTDPNRSVHHRSAQKHLRCLRFFLHENKYQQLPFPSHSTEFSAL
jgi:hypothetical protein